MISKKDILKFAKDVSRRTRGVKDHRPIHPRRDWLIGLFVFFVVGIIGGLLSIERYTYYDTIDSTIIAQDRTIKRYNAAGASEAIAAFEARQQAFEEVLQETPVMPVAPAPLDATSTPETASSSDEEIELLEAEVEILGESEPIFEEVVE